AGSARAHGSARVRVERSALLALPRGPAGVQDPRLLRLVPLERRALARARRDDSNRLVPGAPGGMMRALPAALAFALLLALPTSAVAHAIPGLVHDAREVVTVQASGTHATIAADGVHLELRRAGAGVVEVLDVQGR